MKNMTGYLAKTGRYIFLAFVIVLISPAAPVQACPQCDLNCVRPTSDKEWNQPNSGTVDVVGNAIDNELNAHETWLLNFIFEDNILPAMQLMAEQLTVVAMQQVQIIGTFFDAKQQMETQRTLQTLQAEAHKDYHPSVGMCEFGSSVKSLAASERQGEYNTVFLAQRSVNRQTGNANNSGAQGPSEDLRARLAQFRETFCNPSDNNNALSVFCETGTSDDDKERMNKDINFGRTIDYPWTLDVDFSDPSMQDDEEAILALSNNLFAHNIFSRIAPEMLELGSDGRLGDAHRPFMDMRSLIAKRSVAENSFNALVGMKSEGTGGSTEYLEAILEELGVTEDEALKEMLGENPSYYAQMEVLTKKIYQNPLFYTNLYDKPANVLRKDAALQAIGLMQKFDMFKSHLRNEATLSVLLELAVMDLQSTVENEMSATRNTGAVEAP